MYRYKATHMGATYLTAILAVVLPIAGIIFFGGQS